jgi:hypothetical protein
MLADLDYLESRTKKAWSFEILMKLAKRHTP